MRARRLLGWLVPLRRLGADQRGAVMMILGLAVIPLFVMLGLAIDVGRGYLVKSKLSYAIDSAGLAGGRAFDTDDREDDVLMFFNANFPPDYMSAEIEGGQPEVTFNEEENTILIEATAVIPTRFMGVTGIHEMRVHARSVIQRELRGMELVLVMDNTGSMRSGGKMDAMKDAADNLIDILYGSREEVPNFWVSLVPYAAQVNIGNQHTDWLVQQGADPDAPWQNADPDYDEQFGYHPDHYAPTTWKGCVEARAYPRDSNDDPPDVEGWYPYLWRTTLRLFENPEWLEDYDSDDYVVVVEDDRGDWDRPGNVIYEQGEPRGDWDDPEVVEYDHRHPETWGLWLNGDNDWNPEGPQSALKEDNWYQNEGTGPNLGCGPAITPLVAAKSTIEAGIAEMQPWHRGGTFANQGLAWGWRVLSPRWRGLWDGDDPENMPLDYTEPNIEKVVILLTDGVNQWYDWPGTNDHNCGDESPPNGLPGNNSYDSPECNDFRSEYPGADYTAYGRLNEERLGTDSNGGAKTEINERMLELCTAMKNEGMIIYTIVFQENDAATEALYRQCATDDSKYFNSPSNAELKQDFVTIADELSNLRIAE